MKKGIITLGVLLLVLFVPKDVMAGNINEYESSLIEIAKGQFEYNGEYYVVTQDNISAVIGYVSQDDVDITAKDKEEIVQAVYSNIKQGISDGYMILANPGSQDGDGTSQVEDSKDVESAVETIIKEVIEDKKETPGVMVDSEKGVVHVTMEDNTQLVTVNTVIKNTGFNLYNTVLMTVGLGVIMVGCMGLAIKYQLFAFKDES